MHYPASQIRYWRSGEGPPALMIHGNPATHTLWRPLVERMGGERTLYTIDLPGFGATPAPSDRSEYAIGRIADALLAFADLHGLGRFDLVGHSFGGAISITIAARAPERLRSLVAITPLADKAPPLASLLHMPMMEQIAGIVWKHASSRFRCWFARQWTHVSYGAGYSPPRSREVALEVDRPDIIRSICALMTEADYDDYHRSIRRVADRRDLPLLLVGAGCDRIIPYAQFQHLRARMERAACHIFPNSGHLPMWQYPSEMVEIISRFWKEVKG